MNDIVLHFSGIGGLIIVSKFFHFSLSLDLFKNKKIKINIFFIV